MILISAVAGSAATLSAITLLWALAALVRRVRASRAKTPTAFDVARGAFTDEEWERLAPLLEGESRRRGLEEARDEDLRSLRDAMVLASLLLDNPTTAAAREEGVRLRRASAALETLWRHRDACHAILDPEAFANAFLMTGEVECAEDAPRVVGAREDGSRLVLTVDTSPVPAHDYSWDRLIRHFTAMCRGRGVRVEFGESGGFGGFVELLVEQDPLTLEPGVQSPPLPTR